VGDYRKVNLVLPLIGLWIWGSRSSNKGQSAVLAECIMGRGEDEPKDITLNGISVLVPTSDCKTIRSLAKIRKSMGANFEFRLINSRIPMSRSLEDTELGPVSCVGAMNVEWKSDCSLAPLGNKRVVRPTFQELMFLVPIDFRFYFDTRLTFIALL